MEERYFHREGGQDIADECEMSARLITVQAGDIYFFHTNMLHASSEKVSNNRRVLLISVYVAEDAFPLTLSPVPNEFNGTVARHRDTLGLDASKERRATGEL